MKDSGSREPLILSPLFYLSSFQTKMKPPLHTKMQRGLLFHADSKLWERSSKISTAMIHDHYFQVFMHPVPEWIYKVAPCGNPTEPPAPRSPGAPSHHLWSQQPLFYTESDAPGLPTSPWLWYGIVPQRA